MGRGTDREQRFTHLKAADAEELISRSERYLNEGGEFCHLFCTVILNVSNILEQR